MSPVDPDGARQQARRVVTRPLSLAGERLIVQEVYAKLRSFIRLSAAKGKRYVHPAQQRIADELAVELGWPRLSARTVMRAIARLVKLGAVLKDKKTPLGNRYYFPDWGGPEGQPEGRNVTSQVTPVVTTQVTKRAPECHLGSDTAVTSDVTSCHYPLVEDFREKKDKENSSSRAGGRSAAVAAAEEAPLFAGIDREEAERILHAHELPPGRVEAAILLRGVQFVLEIGQHLSDRAKLTKAGKVKPLANPGGYVRGLIDNPEAYGFRQLNDLWRRPGADLAEEAAKTRRRREDDLARQRAEAEQDRRLQVERAAWSRRWDAAAAELRAAVEAAVRARGVPDLPNIFREQCVAEYRRRVEGGA